jgi:N-acetylneuraminate synthase
MVFIVAEIGINHNGDVELAKKMIDVAKNVGCDAVKFQKRTIEKVYSKEVLDSPRDSPWGKTTREQKLGIEFGQREYDEIDRYCFLHDMEWYASAWDVDSQKFLRQYNLKHNKIASAMLTDYKLLETVAEEKKLTFISTGMSTMDEVRKAVEIFKKYDCPFELMHCNSAYPMDISEANLLCIPALKKEFNCNVGYSGHEVAGYLVCVSAVLLGATSIERHMSLDRTLYGSDQVASLEPLGWTRLVRDIRKVKQILGDGKKRIWDSELPAKEKLRKF